MVENNSLENKHVKEPNKNFRTYGCPEKVVESGIQEALKVSQTESHRHKTIENNNALIFISTFNPNNAKILDLVKSGVNILVETNVNDYEYIGLIQAKRQPSDLKGILTSSLFTNKTGSVFKCSDNRCLCLLKKRW